ncbi:protoporphyrinogen oxidase [Salinicoccus halitifaciens]|uniref:Coproporphyrinogen III oxidase n=1 Tax=Salinicoccus halitifaciens TaxID=1073415 RepID=A0ABV2E5D9_9STAP|nr:protoporphyrinogen oxidase [Salinicoccus halitifaciens]MCD2137303.1 protoporphyrinogen oxidase [Salinicoccus halitifaciens]
MTKVAIIGAGITGLSAGFYLTRDGQDIEVDIYEKADHAGGKIKTYRKDGFVIELGPESYLSRKEALTDLAKEIGLEGDLVRNETGQAYIYARHQLHPVPPGTMLGVPTEIMPFLTSSLISVPGKLRALMDLAKGRTPLYTDVSAGSFFRERLGDEVLENLIDPLLSGVYSTPIDKLSLMSTYPDFKHQEQKYGSLIKGMIKAKQPKKNTKKVGQFFQFKNGLSSFIERLQERVASQNANLHFNSDVEAIVKSGEGYKVTVNGKEAHYDQVIITTPHFQYKRWFDDKELEYFKHMPATSVATVVMSFDADQVKNDIDGTGFVVSRNMDTSITACTWTNKKWKHSTPEGKVLLRAYVGKPGDFIVEEKSEEDILRLARKDLDRIMDIEGEPELKIVTKLKNSMPNYNVGHKEMIDGIHEHMEETYPGIQLIGASHYAVGLPDCVKGGREAAENVLSGSRS